MPGAHAKSSRRASEIRRTQIDSAAAARQTRQHSIKPSHCGVEVIRRQASGRRALALSARISRETVRECEDKRQKGVMAMVLCRARAVDAGDAGDRRRISRHRNMTSCKPLVAAARPAGSLIRSRLFNLDEPWPQALLKPAAGGINEAQRLHSTRRHRRALVTKK